MAIRGGRIAEWLMHVAHDHTALAIGLPVAAYEFHKVKPFRSVREGALEFATGDPNADKKLLEAGINVGLQNALMPPGTRKGVYNIETDYQNGFYDPSYISSLAGSPDGSLVFGLYNDRLRG